MERTIKVLNAMQGEGVILDFVLGGAIAALFYIEPIETHDLDVFISLPETKGSLLSLDGVYSYLAGKGYVAEKEHVAIEGIPVQFLVASTPLVEEAMTKAVVRDYGTEKVRVMDPEHLVAIMVELNRPKDRIRLSFFLDEAPMAMDRLNGILEGHGLKDKWSRILKEIGHETN
jgi:hypothetical protein